ncbi:MAG: adenosine kinase [Bacteroidales bacterium]
MKKVIGMGNALVDIMTRLKNDDILKQFNLPRGSMQLIDHALIKELLDATMTLEKKLSSGGSAANTMHGLARLGIHTAFIGKTGNDEFGKVFRDDLQASKIEALLFPGLSPTGRSFAMVSPDGERTMATFLGAAVELLDDDIDSGIFHGYDYFHVEGYLVQNHRLIEKSVRLAKKAGLKVSLDMASYNVVQANRQFFGTLLEEYVDVVFANEEEAIAYTGKDPESSLGILAKDCEIAVVKLGKNGSLIQSGSKTYRAGIIKAHCLDTTGAGDLYAAGFLFGLCNGLSLDKCGKAGAILSGKVIEQLGAKISEEVWTEIHEMISGI